MSLVEVLRGLRETDVTKTVHQHPYPAISVTRPQLNQTGKTILITGGGTGVGLATAQAFIRATASTIIIIGRRTDVLQSARSVLEQEVQTAGTGAKIITRSCDVTNLTDVDALWKDLGDQGITVDVYVANAAKFTEIKPMMELGADDIWSQMEVNVKSPLYFAERFYKQPGEQQRFIVNVSTASIHALEHPEVIRRPAYTLSKLSGTLFFQLLASDLPHSKLQIISFHPGLIFNDSWKSYGAEPENFDDDQLTGSFAVWAASKEASFLHGRYVWSSWDVEELATGELRKRIDEDYYFLRASIAGLKGSFLA